MLGFLSNPKEALDLLVTHFFLTNASQTSVYRGSIETAQSILQKYANDVPQAASEMTEAMNRLLRKYFDDASIVIEHRLYDPTTSNSVVQFTISGVITDNNINYQLNKLVETRNGTFQKFVEINNG